MLEPWMNIEDIDRRATRVLTIPVFNHKGFEKEREGSQQYW